jgi:hypothetical protein
MKKLILLTSALLFTQQASIIAKADPFILAQEENADIIVNNRILARINEKAISVVDLMKKLDMLFFREFPQYTSSKVARFQFYQANWKSVLQDLINKELILADAEENKLPISSGDVRQEMEQLFGPNIISNLDQIGLSFDDAWKIVQGDITIRRMMYMRVNAKAVRGVTPQDVWETYEEHVKKIVRPDEWAYRVISLRSKEQEEGALAANLAYNLLTEHNTSLDQLAEALKKLPHGNNVQVNVSESFHHADKEVSENYKASLSALEKGQYSQPVAQKSRDKSTVFRIFYLEDHVAGGPIPFQEAEARVKDKLIEIAIAKESEIYLNKLRKHFAIHDDDISQISGDFQPFVLKQK